jgi:hypothetical protein
MAFSVYDASVPLFVNALNDMRGWLDKAVATRPEAELIGARLVPDMSPLPAQFQMASDSAKGAIARLAGIEPPAMPDTETSFAELKARCDKTIAFITGIDPAVIAAGAAREAVLALQGGMGFRMTGADFLTRFSLPNFFFHASMAYAILRKEGVPLGKADFLAHMGMPEKL